MAGRTAGPGSPATRPSGIVSGACRRIRPWRALHLRPRPRCHARYGGCDRAGPGGPGQGDVTNPSYFNPAPQTLSNSQQLQLKAYRNQLNQQQQDLQIQQSHGLLTPNQQQRMYQTQQESNRVNQMLSQPSGPVFTMPAPSLSVGPPPLIH